MPYKCTNITIQVSKTEIRNDAYEFYWDLQKQNLHEKVVTGKDDVIALFHERKGKIPAQQKYMEYEFLDTETNEMLYLFCSIRMDKVCRANNLYPDAIFNSIIDWELNNSL